RAAGRRRAEPPTVALQGRDAAAGPARGGRAAAGAGPGPVPAGKGRVSVEEAYAACREISRTQAKNFYYAFVALPAPRRNAICAFRRGADDLSDDESLPREERRRRLEAWRAAWRESSRGGATSDPVFLAVRDATARFAIPLGLLEELVGGVAADLESDGGRV